MSEEIFEIVDEKNEVIGTAPRSEVHKKGLFHRGVHGFLVNSEGKVFLQKRAEAKDTSPGYWGMSVGEHSKPGETNEQAINRGLKEELGIAKAKITMLRDSKLFHTNHDNGTIDNEFDALFLIETDEQPVIDREELSGGRFFSREDIENYIKESKRKFTPFFLAEWEEFKKSYN